VRLIDPHVHMSSRTTDDYRAMAAAGIVAVVEPAIWLGQPRSHVGTFDDYFASLVGWERHRAAQFGVHHYCALALNPKEANDPNVAAGVMSLLPRWLEKDDVVGVGEIGYDEQTRAEDKYLALQLELAKRHRLPALVHTPQRDKKRAVMRVLAMLRELSFPEHLAVLEHNDEETLPLVLGSGCWAGLAMHPRSRIDERRLAALVKHYGPDRLLVSSAADWGVSDPLKVPKAAALMYTQGIPAPHVARVFWHNPMSFFAQSGRMSLQPHSASAALH
jgi:uncharacterized protein